jgi:FkbM family methyltransferase
MCGVVKNPEVIGLMNFVVIKNAIKVYGWRDFIARVLRRLSDWLIPQVSYSQAGEDIIIDVLFMDVGISHPRYLELGTNHPKMGNNTYKFYRKGSRGVLVEAAPSLIPAIRSVRPRDTVLNIGVGEKSGEVLQFHEFDCSGINTFDEQEAKIRVENGHKVKQSTTIPILSVNDILARHCSQTPDFLSIDIEGLDLMVLKSLDWEKYPIPVVCVETCLFSNTHIRGQDKEIPAYMESIGYFAYGNTYINTIFVRKSWFDNPKAKRS